MKFGDKVIFPPDNKLGVIVKVANGRNGSGRWENATVVFYDWETVYDDEEGLGASYKVIKTKDLIHYEAYEAAKNTTMINLIRDGESILLFDPSKIFHKAIKEPHAKQ